MRIASRIALLPLLATLACNFPRPTGDDMPGDDTPGDDGPAPGADTAYQLRAAEPAVATTGQTLRLEGTFGTSATVHFPGGATQPATILGPHRATVTVPEGATAGDLTVETAGTTLGPLPFRRTTFALGLQPFESPFAQSNGQRQRAQLAVPRAGHTAVAIGNYMYAIGGTSLGSYLSSVERALINADGSLGMFNVMQDVTLTAPRAGQVSAVIGSWLYILGGANDTGILNSVERAPIGADGSLGAFAAVDAPLTGARSAATAEIIGKWLYLIGGNGVTGSVERAPINPDGSLGSFEAIANAKLSIARAGHTSAVVGSSLFVVGGSVSGNLFGSVEQAPVNPDGSLGAFTVVADVSLATARFGHVTAVVGDYLYVLSGTGRSGDLATTERAQVTNGTLGAFSTVAAVTVFAATGSRAVTTNNYFYQIGGVAAGMETRSIRQSSINASGAIAPFATVAGAQGPTVSRLAIVAIGPFIYAVSALSNESVQRARVRADGSIEPFQATQTKLKESHVAGSVAIIGDNLYVFGGSNSTAIEAAPIRDNGDLGVFGYLPGIALPLADLNRTCVVIGDSLYVWGGLVESSRGYDSHLLRAAITNGGGLASFIDLGGQSVLGREGEIGMVIAGYVYAIGGNTHSDITGETTAFSDIYRAGINNDGTLTTFDATGLGSALGRWVASAVVLGNAIHLIAGLGNSGFLGIASHTTTERTTIGAGGTLSSFALDEALKTISGRVQSVTIKNTLYVFGSKPDGVAAVEQATLH